MQPAHVADLVLNLLHQHSSSSLLQCLLLGRLQYLDSLLKAGVLQNCMHVTHSTCMSQHAFLPTACALGAVLCTLLDCFQVPASKHQGFVACAVAGGVYDDNTSSVQTPVTDSPSRLHHSTSAQAIDLMADGRSPSSLNPNTPDMAGNAKTSSTPSCLRQHPALWPSINNPVSQEQQEQQQLQPGTDNQQQAAAADQHSRQHNINPKPFAFGHGGNRVHPDSSLNVSPLQPNLDAHEDVACSASTLDGRHVPSAAAGHQHNAWVTDASNEPAGNAVPCSPRAGAQMTADSASNDSMHAAARPSR